MDILFLSLYSEQAGIYLSSLPVVFLYPRSSNGILCKFRPPELPS